MNAAFLEAGCVDEVYGDENGYGFGVYVKDENLYIECAYANAFDEAFENFAKNKIYDAMNTISFADNYTYYDSVSTVRYSKFGAEGDGKTDDFEAILATHKYANEFSETPARPTTLIPISTRRSS